MHSPQELKELVCGFIKGMADHRFFGSDDLIKCCLSALYTGGHVLLEGDPGVGKTKLVSTLNKVLNMDPVTGWRRIQFTPDLLPSDITGTEFPMTRGNKIEFEFREGPIFATLVLADEINRATPKLQSALLEAMGERQVSVLGTTYVVPTRLIKTVELSKAPPEPFMVLATQNPIDHEGTYELPKALLDRFMFKLQMPKLKEEHLHEVLQENCFVPETKDEVVKSEDAKADRKPTIFETTYQDIRAGIRGQGIDKAIYEQIKTMALVTNKQFCEIRDELSRKRLISDLQFIVESNLAYGLGPRAWSSLYSAIKAEVYLFRNHGPNKGTDDIGFQKAALKRLMKDTLRHRLVLKDELNKDFEARADAQKNAPADYFLDELYEKTKVA